MKTRMDHEVLKFLSPCWGKEFMTGVFCANETIFGAFVQEIMSMPISLLLALYLVYPKYLFNMGPAYMFSGGVETLRIDGYLALVLLTHGELVSFHRLMKNGEPLSMGKTHSSIDTYSYKSAAGLKTLLVEYLLMQNRYMTGEEKNPKTSEEWRTVNGGMPLLTDLCLAMRSDPMGIIRGLEEVVNCIYEPTVPRSSSDGLSQLRDTLEPHKCTGRDGAQLVSARGAEGTNEQHGILRKSEGSRVDVVQFPRMGGKREGPIETYPKFWNLNPLTASGQEILRIPAWRKSFELVKRELEAILEKEILSTTIPEFPTVRRITLGMNSPLEVHPSSREQRRKSSKRGSLMAGIPCSLATLQRFISTLVR